MLSVSKNGEKTREYAYNKINNIVSSTVDGVTTTYVYNGDRLRESKTTNGVTTRHIYDGTDVVADVTGDTTTNFVRGIGLIYSENMNTGDKRQYALNAHGDVAKRINADGTAEKFNCRAYGIGIVGTPDPFGYCGEYTNSETGLIYLRNRYYDPELGRFINVDPVFSGANWYAYCEGNPFNRIDPHGTTWTYFDSFLPEWSQNRIEQLTSDYYAVGDSLNEYGGYVRDDIHNEAFNLRMQFLDLKWVKYAIIDIADTGITENNYHQFIYETNMTYYQMVYEYAITLQDMKNQGGEMPRNRSGHIEKWFLNIVGGSMAPGSNFKNAIDDYNNNPNNWKKTNESIQNSTNVRNKGGRSIEQEFTNKNTGERIYRHILEKSDGSLFEQPHFRPYPKQLK